MMLRIIQTKSYVSSGGRKKNAKKAVFTFCETASLF